MQGQTQSRGPHAVRGAACVCCLWGDVCMKVSDVDINIIHKLLLSVPQGMEIHSIDLTDGYNLRLIAGTDVISQLEYENSLQDLRELIKHQNRDVKKIGG